ncbi:MAG: AGE family epimerase/isomerase [Actinomycetaceae bacterium]|nr:AGE family epimerase/isomerase [Actinomycetaceae bacterium]
MLLSESEQKWLDEEFWALAQFAERARVDAGFSTMDAKGNADQAAGLQLWINCRMTHVFCLAALRGNERARDYAAHGIRVLRENFYDTANGGFYDALTFAGDAPLRDRKLAYAHAFVLLAASSGMVADIEGARELFVLAEDAHERHFWEPAYGLVCESFDASFTESEAYRGANANMHTLEASLACFDATGNPKWLAKAASILSFVLEQAYKIGWRIPEHFDTDWQLLPDFNRDNPADPFRPYGLTPGHGIEWARLAVNFWAAAQRLVGELDEAMAEFLDTLPRAAYSLFMQALEDGWAADGEPGLVYTTDFSGAPVVHERMHWTICEGAATAATLATYSEQAGRDEDAAKMRELFNMFVGYARQYLVEKPGQWIHELDRNNHPSFVTWPGKPDVYHGAQAMLVPTLPLTPTFATALARQS